MGSESALDGSWRAEIANGRDAAEAAAGVSATVAKAVALTSAKEGKWIRIPWFSRLGRRGGSEEARIVREEREKGRGRGGRVRIEAMAVFGIRAIQFRKAITC